MNPPQEKPLLAVTMGDSAGIGPEVIVKAWQDPQVHDGCRAVVLGHPEVLRKAIRLVGIDCRVLVVDSRNMSSVVPSCELIPCLPCGADELLSVAPGTIDARTGQAAYLAVMRGAQGTLQGEFDALVTNPISKAALHAAGHHYPGHTELLAEFCQVEDFAMMLYLPAEVLPECRHGLAVVHVTLHVALRDMFSQLTSTAIQAKCHLVQRVMIAGFGLKNPRIGVCALNPHAGEDGLFGDEEKQIIAPAVEATRRHGLQVTGPEPADTLLVRARAGEFDAVVAMYHDQGHIAFKLLGMHRAVNVTLGLPIIRTSVAHGTAFDRAWQGSAEASGLIEAMGVAAKLVGRRG
jgi:4-hydroxythreonine-4-phosphate dehydrogenase